jgi:hypothetical protein
MAAASSPVGLSPPLGERFFHQMEWLTWPPRWNARFFSLRKIAAWSPLALGDGVVETLHVRRMVLAVVNLVDLARDVRLEGAAVVVQVRQGVLGHEGPSGR